MIVGFVKGHRTQQEGNQSCWDGDFFKEARVLAKRPVSSPNPTLTFNLDQHLVGWSG